MERNSSEQKALAKLFSDKTEKAMRHIFAPVLVEFKNYSAKDQYIIKTVAQQTADKDLSNKRDYNFTLLGYVIGFRFNFKLDNVAYALKQVPSEIALQLYVLQRFWAKKLLKAIDEDNPLGGGEEIVLSNVRRRTRKNPAKKASLTAWARDEVYEGKPTGKKVWYAQLARSSSSAGLRGGAAVLGRGYSAASAADDWNRRAKGDRLDVEGVLRYEGEFTHENPYADDYQIADTPESIALFRLLALRAGLRLEALGMKARINAYVIVKKEFGFKGTKKEVLAQLNSYIQELKDNQNRLGGGQEKVIENPHKSKKGHYASVIAGVQKSARAASKRRSSAISRRRQMGVKYQW